MNLHSGCCNWMKILKTSRILKIQRYSKWLTLYNLCVCNWDSKRRRSPLSKELWPLRVSTHNILPHVVPSHHHRIIHHKQPPLPMLHHPMQRCVQCVKSNSQRAMVILNFKFTYNPILTTDDMKTTAHVNYIQLIDMPEKIICSHAAILFTLLSFYLVIIKYLFATNNMLLCYSTDD